MKDIEKILRKVDGNMSMEGIHLNEEDKERIRVCLNKKESFDNMARALVKKHRINL
jgi:Na+/phosphate symporter